MYRGLDLLLRIIIQQYFASSKCLIMISDSSNLALNIPLGILVVNVDVRFNISIIDDIVFHNFGCENIIINVENPCSAFLAIESELPKHTETFNNRKYIIFSRYQASKIFDVFENKAIHFVSNIILICLDNVTLSNKSVLLNEYDVEVSVWTHTYTGFQPNTLFLLDKWFSVNESFHTGRKLFYDKVENQHGRRLKVGAFDYRPYVIVDERSEELLFSGVEIQLLRIYAQYVNATLEIEHQTGMWGLVFSNNGSFGLRGNVYKDNLDIGAAGFFMSQLSMEQFDVTNIYLLSELTCLVPAPRPAPPWLSPYYSFKLDTWIALVVTYFALGFAVYLDNCYEAYITRSKTNQMILIQNTVAAVGKPIIFQPITIKEFYFKPMLVLVLLVTMILCNAYNAGFASVMTKPTFESSINTLEDFLNSDIRWGGVQVADWILSWQNGDEEKYRKAANRYISTTPEQLRQLSYKRNFAFKIERISKQHHIDPYIGEDIIENYRVMKDAVHTQYIVLILRKNSILLPIMNKIIGRFLQSGIIEFWTRESVGHRDYIMQKKLQYLKLDSAYEPVNLKLMHVFGAFFLFLLGNCIAFIVFLFELLLRSP